MMNRIQMIGAMVVAVALFLGSLVYYFVMDGAAPEDPDFRLNLATLRQVADSYEGPRPTEIRVEVLARDQIPFFAIHAGLDGTATVMARSVFQLKSGWGDSIIDVGMDRVIAERNNSGDTFDDDALSRVQQGLSAARRIVVTHEHPDHIALLARLSDMTGIAPKLRLTQKQIDGTARYSTDGKVPAALANLEPLDDSELVAVAPGVVMIPAAGHTPGNVMFYVHMADGSDILFVGDVVWNMKNIEERWGRPRMVQQYLMQTPEDRNPVLNQVAALADLKEAHPDVVFIPSHDDDHLTALIERDVLAPRFTP